MDVLSAVIKTLTQKSPSVIWTQAGGPHINYSNHISFCFFFVTDSGKYMLLATSDGHTRASGERGGARCSHCGQRTQSMLQAEVAPAYSH